MLILLSKLFVSFFKVSLFSFGGAYAQIPLFEKEIVELNQWLTHDEFLLLIGSSQVIPGAIAVKVASYVGFKEAGIVGAIVSIFGGLLVPAVLIILLYKFLKIFEKYSISKKVFYGIACGTWGLIIGYGVQSFLKTEMAVSNIIIGVTAIVLIVLFKASPIIIICISAILGVMLG